MFSAFPNGWPGIGMLLLRMLVGVTVIAQVLERVGSAKLGMLGWLIAVVVFVNAGCLLVGFLTPAAAVVTAVSVAFSSLTVLDQTLELVVLAVAIALIGPGAFSIDARMFGRREIVIPNTTRSSRP